MAGCTARQLTVAELDPCYRMPLPTSEDVNLARRRLEQGFAFVGITEQWDLSVCLFRAMFGGECVSSDFSNTRQGNLSSSTSLYDTSELYGFVDVYDGPLYAKAQTMFEQDLKLYEVDEDKCAV